MVFFIPIFHLLPYIRVHKCIGCGLRHGGIRSVCLMPIFNLLPYIHVVINTYMYALFSVGERGVSIIPGTKGASPKFVRDLNVKNSRLLPKFTIVHFSVRSQS